jgi:hydrogenase expression/formation protein HypD
MEAATWSPNTPAHPENGRLVVSTRDAHGIDQLLPAQVEMTHGPACPACVIPLEIIDRALAIAAQPGVIFCSFGDMLRVPGSAKDLFRTKSAGGDVRADRQAARPSRSHSRSVD